MASEDLVVYLFLGSKTVNEEKPAEESREADVCKPPEESERLMFFIFYSPIFQDL